MSSRQSELPFLHRIVRRRNTYKIQSVCERCGDETISAHTEAIVDWERAHQCRKLPASEPAEKPKLSSLVRWVLSFLWTKPNQQNQSE